MQNNRHLKIAYTRNVYLSFSKKAWTASVNTVTSDAKPQKKAETQKSLCLCHSDLGFTIQSVQISSVGYGILLPLVLKIFRFIRPCMSKFCFRYVHNC